MNEPASKRNRTIDVFKGFLILMVIIGHILRGSLDENVLRYIIYSFHMPLFLFISGYVTNMEKLILFNHRGLFKKYWTRMLKEWFLAFIVYTTIVCLSHDFTISFFLNCIRVPYYHLWYVPVLLIIIYSSWIVETLVKSKSQRLLVYVFISFIFLGINNYGYLEWFRLRYFVFFYLGLVCKNYGVVSCFKEKLVVPFACLFVILLLILHYIGFSYNDYEKYLLVPFGIALAAWVILPIIVEECFKSRVFEYMGKQSLHLYLWHVLPIMALKQFVGNTVLYYVCCLSLLALFLVYVWVRENREKSNQKC